MVGYLMQANYTKAVVMRKYQMGVHNKNLLLNVPISILPERNYRLNMQQLSNSIPQVIEKQLSVVYNPKVIPMYSSQKPCTQETHNLI